MVDCDAESELPFLVLLLCQRELNLSVERLEPCDRSLVDSCELLPVLNEHGNLIVLAPAALDLERVLHRELAVLELERRRDLSGGALNCKSADGAELNARAELSVLNDRYERGHLSLAEAHLAAQYRVLQLLRLLEAEDCADADVPQRLHARNVVERAGAELVLDYVVRRAHVEVAAGDAEHSGRLFEAIEVDLSGERCGAEAERREHLELRPRLRRVVSERELRARLLAALCDLEVESLVIEREDSEFAVELSEVR